MELTDYVRSFTGITEHNASKWFVGGKLVVRLVK